MLDACNSMIRWSQKEIMIAFRQWRFYAFIISRKDDEIRHNKVAMTKFFKRLFNQKLAMGFLEWKRYIKLHINHENIVRRTKMLITRTFNRLYIDGLKLAIKRWRILTRNTRIQINAIERIYQNALNSSINDIASAFQRWNLCVAFYRENAVAGELEDIKRRMDLEKMSKNDTYKKMCHVILKFLIRRMLNRFMSRSWALWRTFTHELRRREEMLAAQNKLQMLESSADELAEATALEIARLQLMGDEERTRWELQQSNKTKQKNLILNLLNCQLRPPFNKWVDETRNAAEEEKLMEIRVKRARRVVVNWVNMNQGPAFRRWVDFFRCAQTYESRREHSINCARRVIQRWFKGELAWGFQRLVKAAKEVGEGEKKMRHTVRMMLQKKLRAGMDRWRQVMRWETSQELMAAKILRPIMQRQIDHVYKHRAYLLWQKYNRIARTRKTQVMRSVIRALMRLTRDAFSKWDSVVREMNRAREKMRNVGKRMIFLSSSELQRAMNTWKEIVRGSSFNDKHAKEILKFRIKRAKIVIINWINREVSEPFHHWKRVIDHERRREENQYHQRRCAKNVIQRWWKGELAFGFHTWLKAIGRKDDQAASAIERRVIDLSLQLRNMRDKARTLSLAKMLRLLTSKIRILLLRGFQKMRSFGNYTSRGINLCKSFIRRVVAFRRSLLLKAFSKWHALNLLAMSTIGIDARSNRLDKLLGNAGKEIKR